MKNKRVLNFAIWFIGIYIFAAIAVDARPILTDAGTVKNSAVWLSRQDDDDEGFDQCEKYPKAQVFDNIQQALRTPEKVKCLMPSADGELTKIKHLPRGLGKLVNLEVLNLSCLESLEDMPEEIGNLRNLRALIIDNGNGCAMNVSIPASIGNLENLKVLRLYGALDSSAGQESRRGRGKALPATVGNLRNLEVLDLGRNGLNAIPSQIASLTRLRSLHLEYNDLRQVPAFVGNFRNLKTLSLSSNKIATLPASLAKARGLKVYMGNNSLKLRDQRTLRTRFSSIVFSFENEFDDDSANEEPRQTKRRQ